MLFINEQKRYNIQTPHFMSEQKHVEHSLKNVIAEVKKNALVFFQLYFVKCDA